jgi:hypothetical protein
MKKMNRPILNQRSPLSAAALTGVFVFLALGGLFLGGCKQPLLSPEGRLVPGGMGLLSVSLSDLREPAANTAAGATVNAAAGAAVNAARTMLALDPEFSSYELEVSPDPETVSGGAGTGSRTYSSTAGAFQIMLPAGTYTVSAAGYTGDKRTAKTGGDPAESPVTISGGTQTDIGLTLAPYMDEDIYGTLHYSLNWDAAGQIPARAELLVEQYDASNDAWNGIPISLINESLTAGSQRGTILLVRRETGLIQQSGALALPPGEYRLTTTVTMDGPNPPVCRTDIAHVFSNLSTPAAFIYGAGDLTVTGPGTDTGSGYIIRFNFAETPGAVSIVGSNAGPDGTRLIMVMVPDDTDLTSLTPVVECAAGARISSPPPLPDLVDGKPVWEAGNYSRPSSWIAEGRNGQSQQYTVVVTKQAADECLITDLAFQETGLESAPVIDHSAGTINVTAPYGTKDISGITENYHLTPVFSYIGTKLLRVDPAHESDSNYDTPLPAGKIPFVSDGGTPAKFRVYALNGDKKLYTVQITEALSGEAEITRFFFDGYPDYPFTVSITPESGGTYSISNAAKKLPYGTPLGSLKPLITYKGNLNPGSGVEQNFNVPVFYTVESDNGLVKKTYKVTVETEALNADTGIFDFVITNVPRAKVVIGTKPRADGKIPIVVQVPYATSPLIDPAPADGPKTDLKELIARITLSNKTGSRFVDPNTGAPVTTGFSGGILTGTIPFNNQNDYQEAVYRVEAQAGNTQDYVVVAARDVRYYYVKATGDDTDPDLYNGGSETTPFKTLAYAVRKAVEHNVDHIYVIGTLNDISEGGAWEDSSATEVGESVPSNKFGEFGSAAAPSVDGGASVFNLKGTGRDGGEPWRIYITGTGSNAVLQGTAGKRVIAITGNAHITFENITIRDGGGNSYAGNGGGIYIGEGSTVIWKSGGITGNKALSGGGVYVDSPAGGSEEEGSEFDFMTGAISGNTATGSTAVRSAFENNTISAASIQGGGGVYLNGGSLFWLANGEVSGNSAAGSGGGVLVNGDDADNPDDHNFIMSGGSVNGNISTGSVWPHGGGGVFVAKGAFQMLSGHIMSNKSTRQGGGVFVWSRAVFYMEGDSSVTANDGVGSSKAICSRGVTTLRGNAQADKVYVWNYARETSQGKTWGNGFGDEFTLMEGARVAGLVLAFADDPKDNRNYINLVGSDRLPLVNGQTQLFSPGTDPITTIDLESRLLSSGAFDPNATIAGDWMGQDRFLVKHTSADGSIPPEVLKRFPLGTYTYGGPKPISLSPYKLGGTGRLTL